MLQIVSFSHTPEMSVDPLRKKVKILFWIDKKCTEEIEIAFSPEPSAGIRLCLLQVVLVDVNSEGGDGEDGDGRVVT